MSCQKQCSICVLLILGLGLLAGGAAGLAQSVDSSPAKEESVNPDINANFLDPDLNPDEWVARFEVESREVFHSRRAIVEAIGLKEGDQIADIGAGTGLYTMLFAEAVGEQGWVYAVDIATPFVERIGKLADERGVVQVTPVVGSERDVRLAPKSIDAAYVCDTYHHFEYPQSTLASIKRALRPGGRLVIVDFERIEGQSTEWTLSHVRAGKKTVRQEIEAAGFQFQEEKEIEGLEDNYFLMFKK